MEKKEEMGAMTSFGGKGTPAAMAMLINGGQELVVFFRRPWPFLQPHLFTAWTPTHFFVG